MSATATTTAPAASDSTDVLDVVVVGAGFAGIYLLKRLRDHGFRAQGLEAGNDVGGTWYWNRYPGARCDVESLDYSYTWDPDLASEWTWSEKYAPQPEILRYLQFVAEKHDLRRDISFNTRVDKAVWNADENLWHITTSSGGLRAKHYVMATGCLSVPKDVDINGTDRFTGAKYWTSRWPHEGVDFTGMRVGVIGTGSSAIQSIPLIAKQASALTIFQRTPNFSIPAHNGRTRDDKRAEFDADPVAYKAAARVSGAGVPVAIPTTSALATPAEEREVAFEKAWQRGGIIEFLSTYNDTRALMAANELEAEFVRNKIRATVNDPETAETLCPKDYPIGSKRLCVDTGYYETYNLPHVRLVDIRKHPITTITETGLDVVDESFEFDAIVFATGFDAMTGAMVGVDISGRDGATLKEEWSAGPTTYLGLMAHKFPNLYMVTGPGSPSVLSNMVISIEQHVDWITDCLLHLRSEDLDTIEPTPMAVAGWVRHVNEFAGLTLMTETNSWYMGANVPGKPRVFLPYPGGVGRYRATCDSVVAQDYLGFTRAGPGGERCTDGEIERLKPDVAIFLETFAAMNLPALESMSAADARAFSEAGAALRPPGPEVGEIVDATLPGPAGDLAYRLYRPASPGPHAVIVYFHGGGWVLGSAVSDDPFCRDLCVRTGALVVSVDYRHAPADRFPAAADDAFAALQWVASNAASLGGDPARVVVAGWSAGANLAAVVAQCVRDAGGPALAGQLLITPVTDGVEMHPSKTENASGYFLTASLMEWFWDHYADPADRANSKASPLRASSLSGLPPAIVVTCEFDPLRDEGNAYAAAMGDAGVAVTHIPANGHVHTSLHAVDVLPTGAPVRAAIADALAPLLAARVQ
jgi:cation diffusion facilitator CzcD-associated flavoprotein CzcO/acetyl esterase/lipase